MRNRFYPIVTVMIFLGFLLSRFFVDKVVAHRPFDVQTSGLYALAPAELLKTFSLGNQTVLADYLWIKLVLTIGKTHSHDAAEHHHQEHHHGQERIHSEKECLVSDYLSNHLETVLPRYIDTITDLDPQFTYPYLIGYLYAVTDYPNDSIAVALLEKAMDHNPGYWEFPYFYAYQLFRSGTGSDSLILSYLQKSVKAQESIRVFKKDLVFDAYVAFYEKLNPAIRSEKLLEGVLEAFDNPDLTEKLQEHLAGQKNKDGTQNMHIAPD